MHQARNDAIIVTVLARTLHFAFSDIVPSKAFIQQLRQAPFQDPAIARELDEKRVQFRDVFFRIDKLQFGFWARRPTQTTEGLIYTEWEESHRQEGSAIVLIDFECKRLVIQIGEPEINNFIHNVSLGFSDIREAWSGAYFGLCKYPLLIRQIMPVLRRGSQSFVLIPSQLSSKERVQTIETIANAFVP